LSAIKIQKQSLYQVLSLDVVLGSLSVGLFAIIILGVDPNSVWWIVLPLAVWSIYTFDHLVDGFKKKGQSHIYRHRFHYHNRKILFPLIIILGSAAISLSFIFLDEQIIFFGLGLSVFVIFYFILVSFQDKLKIRYIQKEFFIAVVYILGILLAPLVWHQQQLSFPQNFVFSILFVLAWAESVIISYHDFNLDKADGLKSFSIFHGLKKTRIILTILFCAVAIILIAGLVLFDDKVIVGALIIELLMNLILLALIYFPDFFSKAHHFRWVGETVFLFPALIVFF